MLWCLHAFKSGLQLCDFVEHSEPIQKSWHASFIDRNKSIWNSNKLYGMKDCVNYHPQSPTFAHCCSFWMPQITVLNENNQNRFSKLHLQTYRTKNQRSYWRFVVVVAHKLLSQDHFSPLEAIKKCIRLEVIPDHGNMLQFMHALCRPNNREFEWLAIKQIKGKIVRFSNLFCYISNINIKLWVGIV